MNNVTPLPPTVTLALIAYRIVVFETPAAPGRPQPHHGRGLTSLSTSIKTITAKMSLLKQDISTSLTTLPDTSRQGIFDTYDSIGQDIHSLLSDWQSGRTDLIRLIQPEEDIPRGHARTVSIADSGLGVSIAETERKRESCGDWGPAFANFEVA